MSRARKCDRCGQLHEQVKGTVAIEPYYVATRIGEDGVVWQSSWEADLCLKCSKEFLAFIKHATNKREHR